jgi:hypothetical protein
LLHIAGTRWPSDQEFRRVAMTHLKVSSWIAFQEVQRREEFQHV